MRTRWQAASPPGKKEKMADTVRIGIIGCGGIARGHIQRLLGYGAQIAALVDTVEANVERYRRDFPRLSGVPVFRDYRDMLGSVELDAVQINTPHAFHYPQIMDSLEAGLHVLTEKPMVCSVRQAKDVIAKAEETGLTVLISYQRHYQPQFRYIKRKIEEGLIGKVTAIAALQGQDWLRGTAGTWRQKMELSCGGQLNDSGSHLLDILLWTTGLSVERVMSFIDNRGSEVDINSGTAIRFTNGALGTITVIGDCPVWWEDFTVWGESGAIFSRNGRMTVALQGKEPFEPADLPGGSDPDRNFLDVLAGRDVNHTPPVCGLRGIELCEAAWRSAELGRPVSVAELG
jgi:predicted dehydrogenase